MLVFLSIALINGIIWFFLGYKLGKDQGQYSDIEHHETELLENETGKWFLRYTPYQSSDSFREKSEMKALTNQNS